MELICGIDEAGRGPVLGPMVLCALCFLKTNLEYLEDIGVKDSKKLTSKKRESLANLIKKRCHSYKLFVISAKEIDLRDKQRVTLNKLEGLRMAEMINQLKPDIIYIDAADVKEDRFGDTIKKLLEYKPKRIISKHKADDNYPIVSAASILAKCERDTIINNLKKKFGEFGSGYPSDKRTTDFLRKYVRKYKNVPDFARITWETTQKILNEELRNTKITDFFNV